jgi:acetyltransferase-like isoleucine patch superfamily enzyme
MEIGKKIQEYFLNKKIQKEGGKAFSATIRMFYKRKYDITIGYGTYGGCFNSSNIPPGTTFGNYCSIAAHVKIFRANHPQDYFTLHPLFYNPAMGYVSKDQLDRPPINIGHDVWIGDETIILPKVMKIGNGSIIGAGSVVTKDVPPYAVVAGNPAKLIKMRFSPVVIKKLEDSKWWELNKIELIKYQDQFQKLLNEE